jgi:hypothetical protein
MNRELSRPARAVRGLRISTRNTAAQWKDVQKRIDRGRLPGPALEATQGNQRSNVLPKKRVLHEPRKKKKLRRHNSETRKLLMARCTSRKSTPPQRPILRKFERKIEEGELPGPQACLEAEADNFRT